MIDYARANNGPNSSYHNSVLFVEITLKAKTLANTNKLMLWRRLGLLVGAAVSQRIDRANATKSSCTGRGCGRAAVALVGGFSDVTFHPVPPATTQVPPPGATIPPPVCGVCQEPFRDDADELPCCKARVCDACAKEVVAIVTCPFCGGDPSPVDCSNDARSPSPVDCSNDAAIALALSRSWA